MRLRIIIYFCLISFGTTDISFAAGMLYRIQQMKAKRQQQAQGESQENQEENQDQQAPVPLTYQQTIDQRNQALAQAILDAHSPSVSSDNLQTVVNQAPAATPGSGYVAPQPLSPQAPSTQVQDVVDLSEVWKRLDKKSTVWPLLMDDKDKALTVSEYIDRFHKEGVKINGAPSQYVQMIDQIIRENPGMLQRPFGELVQIVTIVNYDFDNGMDKDELAKKVLGEAGYEANKRRFTHAGS